MCLPRCSELEPLFPRRRKEHYNSLTRQNSAARTAPPVCRVRSISTPFVDSFLIVFAGKSGILFLLVAKSLRLPAAGRPLFTRKLIEHYNARIIQNSAARTAPAVWIMRAISELASWSMRPALVLPFVPFGLLSLRLHCLSDAANRRKNLRNVRLPGFPLPLVRPQRTCGLTPKASFACAIARLSLHYRTTPEQVIVKFVY